MPMRCPAKCITSPALLSAMKSPRPAVCASIHQNGVEVLWRQGADAWKPNCIATLAGHPGRSGAQGPVGRYQFHRLPALPSQTYHADAEGRISPAELDQLCQTCRERFDRNPLRMLDCKEEGCKALTKDAPAMLDMLCDECREHFEKLQALSDRAGHSLRGRSAHRARPGLLHQDRVRGDHSPTAARV